MLFLQILMCPNQKYVTGKYVVVLEIVITAKVVLS